MLIVSFVYRFTLDISFFFTLIALFPLTKCMKFAVFSAVKFFAICLGNRLLSLSSKLLLEEYLNCFSSSFVYMSFFRFFVRSSTSSEVSSVILNGRSEGSIVNSFSGVLPIRVQPDTYVASRSILSHSAWIRVNSSSCRSFGSLDLLSGALSTIRFFFLLFSFLLCTCF